MMFRKIAVLLGNGASELFSVERTLRAVGAEIVPVIVEDIVHYTLPMEHLEA